MNVPNMFGATKNVCLCTQTKTFREGTFTFLPHHITHTHIIFICGNRFAKNASDSNLCVSVFTAVDFDLETIFRVLLFAKSNWKTTAAASLTCTKFSFSMNIICGALRQTGYAFRFHRQPGFGISTCSGGMHASAKVTHTHACTHSASSRART